MQAAPTVTGISKKVSRRSLLGVPTPGGGGLGSAIGRHSVTVELLGSWRVSVVAKQRSTLSRQDPNLQLRSRAASQPRARRAPTLTAGLATTLLPGPPARPYRVSTRCRRGHGRSCIVNQMRRPWGLATLLAALLATLLATLLCCDGRQPYGVLT